MLVASSLTDNVRYTRLSVCIARDFSNTSWMWIVQSIRLISRTLSIPFSSHDTSTQYGAGKRKRESHRDTLWEFVRRRDSVGRQMDFCRYNIARRKFFQESDRNPVAGCQSAAVLRNGVALVTSVGIKFTVSGNVSNSCASRACCCLYRVSLSRDIANFYLELFTVREMGNVYGR